MQFTGRSQNAKVFCKSIQEKKTERLVKSVQLRLSSAVLNTQTEPITHPACFQHCNDNSNKQRGPWEGEGRASVPRKIRTGVLPLKTYLKEQLTALMYWVAPTICIFFWPTKTTEKHFVSRELYILKQNHPEPHRKATVVMLPSGTVLNTHSMERWDRETWSPGSQDKTE